MAWEAISSESLVHGLSQHYVAHSLGGWKLCDCLMTQGALRLEKMVGLEVHVRN